MSSIEANGSLPQVEQTVDFQALEKMPDTEATFDQRCSAIALLAVKQNQQNLTVAEQVSLQKLFMKTITSDFASNNKTAQKVKALESLKPAVMGKVEGENKAGQGIVEGEKKAASAEMGKLDLTTNNAKLNFIKDTLDKAENQPLDKPHKELLEKLFQELPGKNDWTKIRNKKLSDISRQDGKRADELKSQFLILLGKNNNITLH